ncbi:glycosyltransferase family protein [Pokkaliibacter sp. CJK22405]|uniref:glycosyltransferase family protein n=1 Tax=Pokkaliibacter sp. CJK22405 TaxID=3384615 RepID=UPI003984CACD
MKVLFYVQHLLGIGHVKRAALVAQGMKSAGLEVVVIQGGESVAQADFSGVRVESLPALRAADASFSGLVDAEGNPADDAFKAKRTEQLLALFAAEQPDALLIESYPFGRGQLRFELEPLLKAAVATSPKPLILSSVRDILQQRSEAKEQKTLDRLGKYFDAVLVHGQADFIPLENSFLATPQLPVPHYYTGYVADQSAVETSAGQGEVIVSAGGGAVGFAIMDAAIRAKPLTSLKDHRWRVLIGPNLPAAERERLEALADSCVIIEPVRNDFRGLLAHAALSISQGGYNTLMDILLTRVPSLIVPFEGTGETEQITRTRALAGLGRLSWVAESSLTPESMAQAIEEALQQEANHLPLDIDGARTTGEIILRLWQERETAHG